MPTKLKTRYSEYRGFNITIIPSSSEGDDSYTYKVSALHRDAHDPYCATPYLYYQTSSIVGAISWMPDLIDIHLDGELPIWWED